MLNIFIMTMFVSNDDNDIDNDHIYQPVEADVYAQSCKNPKAHDQVDLPVVSNIIRMEMMAMMVSRFTFLVRNIIMVEMIVVMVNRLVFIYFIFPVLVISP